MAKKKRYTLDEVNRMYKDKYPYTNDYIVESKVWGDRYRIGFVWYKNLIEIVDKLKLE